MTHLSEPEFVDLVEDPQGPGGKASLDPRRAAHLETCASCRDQADLLRAMRRQTAAVDVPEPSPLFWEHLSDRVRAGVAAGDAEAAAEAARSGWNAFRAQLVPLAVAATLVIGVLWGLSLRTMCCAVPQVDVAMSAPAAAPAARDATPDAENAEVWAVLTAAASGVALEDAHDAGMHVHPAAIDHAVQDLSAAELNELGRLLQSEMKRSSN